MDLSKVSLEDLQAYKTGDLTKVSLEGLKAISATQTAAPVDVRGAKIDAYLAETDALLSLTPGTSARQINQESRFNSQAVSPVGAAGLAQMMPRTVRVLSNRMSRKLDPHNDDDALLMHREVMKENMMKFGNEQDAARAYNSGWDKTLWDNKETNGYIGVLFPKAGSASVGYQATPVRKGATLASLDADPHWVAASKQLYNFKTGKTFQGTDAEASADGQSSMRWDAQNSLKFGYDAAQLLSKGNQDDHNAALYMMDQWVEAGTSVGSFVKSTAISLTDPMNIASLGTLGAATVGKIAAMKLAQTTLRQALLKAVGRTGIQAGVMSGIQAGVADSTKQTIEVSGGRKQSADLGELAGHVAIGAAVGIVVGSAADALLTAAAPMVQRAFSKVVEAMGVGKKGVAKEVVGGVPVPPALAKVEAGLVPEGALIPEGELKPQVTAIQEALPAVHEAPKAPADASNTSPITSSLTREELEAITTREQKGRKVMDDIVPDHPLDARSFLKLEIPDLVHGLRDTRTNQVDLLEKATRVADQLKLLSDKDLASTLEVAREAAWTGGQTKIMHMAGQVLHTDLKAQMLVLEKQIAASPNDALMPQWGAKLAELDTRTIPAMLYDEAAGSFAGSLTRQRQTILNELKGSSVDSLMKEQGISRDAAKTLWEDIVVSGDKSMESKLIVARSDLAIEKALEAGLPVEVFRLQQQRAADLAKVAEAMAPGGGSFVTLLAARGSDILHKIAGGLKEIAISFVFTPTTLAINAAIPLAKTLTLPMIKYLVSNPLAKANVVEMAAHYSAMGSSIRGAWGATKASFAYEQSILTRDSGRMFEGEMVVPGSLGGSIRSLPRLLNASDEFLSQLNYAGFVSGHAAQTAHIDGTAAGLSGKALNTFIRDAVVTAKATMFEAADAELLRPAVNKGVNLGLEGEALLAYVAKQAGKKGVLDALKHGSDKEALDQVRDMLYKKRFSGEGSVSKAAQTLETAMNRHPALALITGQLFFRTPVRAFEEGIRMVPGVQFLAPNFMADLVGTNGVRRQVRAQGEALAGMAITGTVVSLYAAGKVSGDGAYSNYRQDKNRKDGGSPEPYTIHSDSGESWNYKNMDPIATPIKMIVNALERFDNLKIKEAQDGFVNQEAHKKVMAQLTIAAGAITTAISDANLVAGFKGLQDLIADVANPETRADSSLKKVGAFLGMYVPGSLHKLMKSNDPFLRDPATFAQIIQSRLGHDQVAVSDVKTAYSYDALGQKRSLANLGALWNIFSVSTQEERTRGHSEDHQAVMKEMDRLSSEVGLTFTAPRPTRPETGSLDLRTMMTSDGKETLYDRWQGNYSALNPDKALIGIAQSSAPSGTFESNNQRSMKGGMMQHQITALQDAAFHQLLTEEKVKERFITMTIQKAKAGSGLLDYGNRNK